MSNLFRYLLSAEQVVSTLLRAHPEDEAMARAVGGDYERIGVLEHAVLRQHAGLTPTSAVIDVGCGAGRLAVQLARHEGLDYLGTDVVPALLDYARRRAARPAFRFINVDRILIPVADDSADIVCFFSVLTHLLHEESFLYLQEAYRALKPGGRVVFSFLEFDTPTGWTVFEANLDWVRTRVVASQINVFMARPMIRLWARRLGFRVEMLRDGEQGAVTVGPGEATEAVPEGPQGFGQSICVLRKPLPGEAPEEGPASEAGGGAADRRAQRQAERAALRRQRGEGRARASGAPEDTGGQERGAVTGDGPGRARRAGGAGAGRRSPDAKDAAAAPRARAGDTASRRARDGDPDRAAQRARDGGPDKAARRARDGGPDKAPRRPRDRDADAAPDAAPQAKRGPKAPGR